MPSPLNFLNTSVGRKYLTGITGIFLTLFLIGHLAGNLTLLIPDGGETFNMYAKALHDLGPLLWAVEIILIILFLTHAWIGISIFLRRKKARPEDYKYYQTAGGPSKQNAASKTMFITGSVILVFVVLHVLHFKYHAFSPETYTTMIGDTEVVDLSKHVVVAFSNIWIVLAYTAVMVFVGFHLKHGVWSAFISLGAGSPAKTALLYTIGTIVAILLSAGFLLLPIYIYLTNGGI